MKIVNQSRIKTGKNTVFSRVHLPLKQQGLYPYNLGNSLQIYAVKDRASQLGRFRERDRREQTCPFSS
jgi:hypothetical protein